MKAILEFDMNNMEDKVEHHIMMQANDMLMAISEFREYLRKNTKYQSPPDSFDQIKKTFDEMFDDFEFKDAI